MGWLLRSLLPVSDARGASPVKDRNLPAVGNRWAGPMVAVRAGPPIWARPGRERARPGGSSTPAGRHGARAQLGGPEQADLGLDLGGQVGEGHRGVVVVQLQRGVGGVEPLGGATGVLLAV